MFAYPKRDEGQEVFHNGRSHRIIKVFYTFGGGIKGLLFGYKPGMQFEKKPKFVYRITDGSRHRDITESYLFRKSK